MGWVLLALMTALGFAWAALATDDKLFWRDAGALVLVLIFIVAGCNELFR